MPQLIVLKHVFAVLAVLLLAACSLPGTVRDGDTVMPGQADLVIQEPETAEDPYADLFYEVLTGELAGQLGDVEQSMQYYVRAAELSDDPAVAERATRIAVYARDWDYALRAAQRWVTLRPEDLEARQVLGIMYLRKDQLDDAVQQFKKVMDAATDSPAQGYSIIASTLSRAEDASMILDLMDRLVALKFSNPYGHLAYASLAMQAGEYQLAIDQAELAIGFNPELAQARVIRAQALTELGEMEQALAEMKRIVESDPDNDELRSGYARMLLQADQYESASAQFSTLLARNPNNPDILYTLGLIHIQTENYDDARVYFLQLVDMGMRTSEANFYLGRVAQAQGQYDQAVEYFAEVGPGELYLDAQIQIAYIYFEHKSVDAAQHHFGQVRGRLSDHEEIVQLFLAEGQLLQNKNLRQEAYDIYSVGLLEYPKQTDLLYSRALIAEQLDRLDLLESDLQAILEIDPDNANALNALGYTLADHGIRLDEARGYIERAMELKPDDPAITDSMGWVLYRLGKFVQAERYLRRAMAILNDAEIVGHLAEVLWAQGKQDEARALVHEALTNAPEDDYLLRLKEDYRS